MQSSLVIACSFFGLQSSRFSLCYPQSLASKLFVTFALLSSVDVNECELNGTSCYHDCVNTAGSYECRCREGFTFATDGYTCEGMIHYLCL